MIILLIKVGNYPTFDSGINVKMHLTFRIILFFGQQYIWFDFLLLFNRIIVKNINLSLLSRIKKFYNVNMSNNENIKKCI